MKSIASWKIKIKTVSEGNSPEHWTKKQRRHKIQKFAVKRAFLERPPGKMTVPYAICVTRIAPRSLDCHDNLPLSLKWIVDAIASEFTGDHRAGRSDDEISWIYRQEKGEPKEYAVRIEIVI